MIEGVMFGGNGYEVQRDDESCIYKGDMEAALALAKKTNYRWLVYIPQTDQPWAVLAFDAEWKAAREVAEWEGEDGSFYFDGRAQVPVPQDVGFLPPEEG